MSARLMKNPCFGAVQKCSDARRAKNRTTKRIWIYAERCGLQSNTADERFSTAPQLLINFIGAEPMNVILPSGATRNAPSAGMP